MKSIDFPEANIALAKDQPAYKSLYARMCNGRDSRFMCEFELTEEEIEKIVATGKIYYSQFTFTDRFHPMEISVDNPFILPITDYPPPDDENRTSAEDWDDTHFSENHFSDKPCANCGKVWNEHYFSTRQCMLI